VGIPCLKIKLGVAGFLLDIQMKSAIFENCRYVPDQEKILAFTKCQVACQYLQNGKNTDIRDGITATVKLPIFLE